MERLSFVKGYLHIFWLITKYIRIHPTLWIYVKPSVFQGHLISRKIPPKKKRNKNPKLLRVVGILHLLGRKRCCPLFTRSCPLKDTYVKKCPQILWVLSTPRLHEQGKLSSLHENWVMHLARDLGPLCQLLSPTFVQDMLPLLTPDLSLLPYCIAQDIYVLSQLKAWIPLLTQYPTLLQVKTCPP
jgi:hypothetical protein